MSTIILRDCSKNIPHFVADSSTATGLKYQGFVGAYVYNTANTTSITAGTVTTVAMQAEDIDTNGFHDNSVNNERLTIPSGYGGKYLAFATVNWASLNNGNYEVRFHKNGSSPYAPYMRQTIYPVTFFIQKIYDLVAGDYLDVRVYAAETTNIIGSGSGQGTITNFGLIYLGA